MNGSNSTIQDVARRANVSAATVSNLLSGRFERMKPETRQRINEAMKELNYRPSKVARQLRTGQSSVLGLIVPSVENPFWGRWASAMESEALKHGFQVFLCNSERDVEREKEYLEDLWNGGVRSVVIATSLPDIEHVRSVLERGLQVIAFDREKQEDDPPGLVNVSVDNERGGYLATNHLIELGHRRIGFVSGAIATISRQRRLEGYHRALADAGIANSEELVWADQAGGFGDSQSAEFGRRGALELLNREKPPTAFVCINDMFAIGVCAAIREIGRSVPEISVVGFDATIFGELYNPPMTSVQQPLSQMAKEAMLAVLGIASSGVESSEMAQSEPTLVIRASTSVLGS